jgi:hypothetical protein
MFFVWIRPFLVIFHKMFKALSMFSHRENKLNSRGAAGGGAAAAGRGGAGAGAGDDSISI